MPFFSDIKVIEETFVLELEHPVFGTIKFNTPKQWDKIEWDTSGNTLSWQFPDDWCATLDKQNFTYGLGFKFYCRMELSVKYGGVIFPTPIPVVMSSDLIPEDDSSFKFVKPIDIWWGCMAKNTKIMMADGSLKEICQIVPGDYVMGSQMTPQSVKKVANGYEEELIHIESEDGSSIELTPDHPILTTRGLVQARGLNAADRLCMNNGVQAIRYFYPQPYADQVYSLLLENQDNLIANGFFVGDLRTQQAHYKGIERNHYKENYQQQLEYIIQSLDKSTL